MKILIISNLYPPFAKGGAELAAFHQAVELSKRGYDISVLTIKPWEGLRSFAFEMKDEKGIKVYRFFPFNWFSYIEIDKKSLPLRLLFHFEDTFNYHIIRKVLALINGIGPEAIITHNLKGINLNVVRAVRKSKIRHVHVLHDVQLIRASGIMRHGSRLGLADFLYSKITKNIFKSPEIIVSPSRFLIGFYQKRGFFPHSKIQIMPNPVLVEGNAEPLPSDKEKVRFLYLGQLEEQKGIMLLIDAFSRLDAGKAELVIAGRGRNEQKLKEKIKNRQNIEYVGQVRHSKIAELFRHTDITVVPSLIIENSPSVINESFYCGRGVIAPNSGGVPEAVKDGENGFLFSQGSEEELRISMEKILQDRALIEQFSYNLRFFRDQVSPDKHISRLEKLLKSGQGNKP